MIGLLALVEWLSCSPQLFAYAELVCETTLPEASLVVRVAVPCRLTPTYRAAWLLNFGR